MRARLNARRFLSKFGMTKANRTYHQEFGQSRLYLLLVPPDE